MSYLSPDVSLGTRDFSPGYQDTPESDTLPAGATPLARNGWFDAVEIGRDGRRATLAKRPGSKLMTPAAVATGAKCDGLVAYSREDNPNQLIGAWNGAWYRWDEVDVLVAIAGATGYVGGNPARGVLFKNQAFLFDGSKQQLYDGASVRDPGFVKPTGVTALSAAAGPGVTGTYSAKYTWYDQTHNHESSPTESATASLALTNQQRVHTKPSGVPVAHVTHWRAYVRREDTNEAYWMRVATVPIAAATHTEAVVDDARVDRLPLPAENDPPTVTFKVAVAWRGFFLGFPDSSSDMHVSKQGDCESFDPKDVFKVSPGDGKPVRAATVFGTECIIQKPRKSFHLIGSRLPFDIEPLHTAFGSVSQDATIEVEGRLYAWDETKGPYWTDLSNWVPLADYRIEQVLETINLQAVADIRVEHDERASLIIWAVPTIGSARKRTLLAYHYGLDAWLPPMTGLEYGALRQYVANDGTVRLVCGDHWGRLWSLFEGTRDAPSAGTVAGTVTSASSSTLVDSGAAFNTTGAGLAGCPVAVLSPAGVWQWRRVQSNTGTTLTLDTTNGPAWTTTPSAGWTYIVGGIEWYWWTPSLDGGAPLVRKRGHWLDVQIKPTSADHALEVLARFDEGDGAVTDRSLTYEAATGAALWGSAVWGTSVWAGVNRRPRKQRIGRAFRSVQIRFGNYYPDQPLVLTGFALGADLLSRARVPSGAS